MSRAPVIPLAIMSGPAKSENTYTKAWTCMSQRPGMRNLPRPSMFLAPLGTAALAAGPTYEMRLPLMTTVLSEDFKELELHGV